MTRYYARIITADDMDGTGRNPKSDATEYTDLRKIIRPASNGLGGRKERVTLVHADGREERVNGLFLESGIDE